MPTRPTRRPKKDGNHDQYTFHWDDIRFSGPRLPLYEVFEAGDVVNLQSSAGASIGSTLTQVIALPRVDRNAVPACAARQWWWDAFNAKGTEIQLDP